MEKAKDQQDSDQDSDKEERDEDEVMDIDGFQKSKVTSYGNSDSEVDPSDQADEE